LLPDKVEAELQDLIRLRDVKRQDFQRDTEAMIINLVEQMTDRSTAFLEQDSEMVRNLVSKAENRARLHQRKWRDFLTQLRASHTALEVTKATGMDLLRAREAAAMAESALNKGKEDIHSLQNDLDVKEQWIETVGQKLSLPRFPFPSPVQPGPPVDWKEPSPRWIGWWTIRCPSWRTREMEAWRARWGNLHSSLNAVCGWIGVRAAHAKVA